NDPRWDHQTESRDWFYASLVAELSIDLARLRVAFDNVPNPYGDDAAWLTLGVFELSARRGLPGAVGELRRYLRLGRDVQQAVDRLLPFVGHPEAAGLLEDLLEVTGPDELSRIIEWVGDFTIAPWPQWRRTSSEIDAAIEATLAQRTALISRPNTGAAQCSREERARKLLVQVGLDASPGTPASRLTELAEGRDEILLEIAPSLLSDQSIKLSVGVAIRRSLWGLTSPRALEWARSMASMTEEGGLAAIHLLANISVPEDLPLLRELLSSAVAEGNDSIHTQCSLVEGLGRLGDIASIAQIEALFDATVYSYLRGRCARALSAISDDFMARRATECLYDCESGTRLIAVNSLTMKTMAIRQRLARMVDDPTEEDNCRQAARIKSSELFPVTIED
ncbi:MAG: HEAT repeat domain-containing protein, partial [Candidatus Dormibacteraceae bacterium]